MDFQVLSSLKSLEYTDKEAILNIENFKRVILNGFSSTDYSKIVEWLTTKIGKLVGFEEHTKSISGPEDTETFLMELNGFFREYGSCPHIELFEGALHERLSTPEKKLQLLKYLTSELEALRIIAAEKPQELPQQIEILEGKESIGASILKDILITLAFPRPPETITFYQLFSKIENKVKELLSKVQSAHLGASLLKASLSDKQWENVEYINEALKVDYELRRAMLLERLDVTMQSFYWADKQKEQKIKEIYAEFRIWLSKPIIISIADILAAKEDLLKIEKTSSGQSREKTKCSLNRHIIGKVPDRGGRAFELEPPPPEMPSFMARNQQGGFGGDRGRGGNRGGRGGEYNRGGGGQFNNNPHQKQNFASRGGGGWSQNLQFNNYGQSNSNVTANAFFGGGSNTGYQDNRGGYQDFIGVYQDNKNSHQDFNRDGYQDDRRGSMNRGRGNRGRNY